MKAVRVTIFTRLKNQINQGKLKLRLSKKTENTICLEKFLYLLKNREAKFDFINFLKNAFVRI